jgi:hypothetical protein
MSQAPVAHIYTPSYSEGRDQEDCGLKQAQENSWPYQKYLTEKGLVEWLKCRSWVEVLVSHTKKRMRHREECNKTTGHKGMSNRKVNCLDRG